MLKQITARGTVYLTAHFTVARRQSQGGARHILPGHDFTSTIWALAPNDTTVLHHGINPLINSEAETEGLSQI